MRPRRAKERKPEERCAGKTACCYAPFATYLCTRARKLRGQLPGFRTAGENSGSDPEFFFTYTGAAGSPRRVQHDLLRFGQAVVALLPAHAGALRVRVRGCIARASAAGARRRARAAG